MNVTSRQLAAFVSVAKLRNFTRAAEENHMTQSGLSVMMRELEGQLKCRLFNRTTRSVTLTSAGEVFFPVALRMISDLSGAVAQLEEVEAEFQSTLRIGCIPLLAASLLPDIHQVFSDKHPEIELKLSDGSARVIRSMLQDEELDCGIGMGTYCEPVPGIERTVLCQAELIYVCAANVETVAGAYRDGGVLKLDWHDLPKTPLLALPRDSAIQQLVDRQMRSLGLNVRQNGPFNHIETLIAMAAAGGGSAIVPSFAMEKCRYYGVQVYVLANPELTIDLYLITKRGRLPPSSVNDLSALIMSVVGEKGSGSN